MYCELLTMFDFTSVRIRQLTTHSSNHWADPAEIWDTNGYYI